MPTKQATRNRYETRNDDKVFTEEERALEPEPVIDERDVPRRPDAVRAVIDTPANAAQAMMTSFRPRYCMIALSREAAACVAGTPLHRQTRNPICEAPPEQRHTVTGNWIGCRSKAVNAQNERKITPTVPYFPESLMSAPGLGCVKTRWPV